MYMTTTSPIRKRESWGAKAWSFIAALTLAVGFFGASMASAAGTVSFTSPPDGSSAPVGTHITPTGQASITGATGDGLDLVLVLDSSGSMGFASQFVDTDGDGTPDTSLADFQKQAAIALVNNLPTVGVSVAVVEFDSDANTLRNLTPLTPASNIALIEAAINSVDASGGTTIGTGIDEATAELLANGTAGRSQQMLVLSDGDSSGDPAASAALAVAAGIDAVNTVGLPGANVAEMQAIATAGNGTFTDVTSNIQDLIDLFSGQGGTLVGVQSVEITDPDGNTYNVAVDALGNFTADPFNIALGPNTWTAQAFFTDGTSATDTVTVNGTQGVIPLPAGLPLLLGGLGMLGVLRARRRKQS